MYLGTVFDSIGDRLRHVRALARLSQNELAGLAGLKSTRHVGLIEEGERDNVTTTTSTGLCTALGMSLDWFLAGKGEPPSEEEVHAAVAAARIERERLHALPEEP